MKLYDEVREIVESIAKQKDVDLNYAKADGSQTWWDMLQEEVGQRPKTSLMKAVLRDAFEHFDKGENRVAKKNLIFMTRQFDPTMSIEFEKRTYITSPKQRKSR